MQALVRAAMEEGALGVGSSLIYAPAFYAKTDELIALAKAARSTAACTSRTCAAKATLARGRRRADYESRGKRRCRAEIYHLKAAGEQNWPKMDSVIARDRSRARRRARRSPPTCTPIPPARLDSTRRCRRGCRKAAYASGSSGCKDPAIRARVRREMTTPTERVGESLSRRRLARARAARRVQDRTR